jgi:hypothetical protein
MSTPQFLNQNEIKKLADDPKNRVFEYQYDTATATFTIAQQKHCITTIRNLFLELRKTQPDWSDVKIQEDITSKNNLLKSFAENNTKIFEKCASRQSSENDLNHIKYMLYLRDQCDAGAISESQAQETIQNYLITQFKTNMTIDEYKKQMADEKAKKKNNK